MNESIVGFCLILAMFITCNGQNIQPAAPVGSANIPHAAYVDRLLADARSGVHYAELTLLNINDINALIERYRSIPCITNRTGIVWALAHRGDDCVVDLFWNTLSQEYAGRRFSDSIPELSEGLQLADLMENLGLKQAHYDS